MDVKYCRTSSEAYPNNSNRADFCFIEADARISMKMPFLSQNERK